MTDGQWALDELDRVVGAEALASKSGKHSGGEWDYLMQQPAKTRRRLIGAGYMRVGGMQPDQLAELIIDNVATVETTDAAMFWYVNTCLVALKEARLLAGRRFATRTARRNGHQTYYQPRTAEPKRLGYRSVYNMRKARGWG
jgi:hypothetical protein